MKRRSLCTAVAVLTLTSPALGASPDTLANQAAASWLGGEQVGSAGQAADAIVALRAAGWSATRLQDRADALQSAAGGYATTPGAAGKVVLAAVAAGRDPRSFGGVDYVTRIQSAYRNGRYGGTAYDQAYAMLGLRAAGVAVPAEAIRTLRRARKTGGWGFSVSGGSDDVSATGLLMEALRASGVAPSDPVLAKPAVWIAGRANRSGGFNINGGARPTEANSTAIAIRAWRAAGRKPLARWRVALRSLQESDGGVRFTAGVRESRVMATVDAMVAFSGKRLPTPY